MTDKEMQALAAQAAGLKVKAWWEKYPGEWWADLDCESQLNDPPTVWSSLHDDGDALRLAVKLNLTCRFYSGNACAQATTPGGPSAYEDVTNNDDPMAGARLAITRAAAALAVSDLAKMKGAP